MGPYSLLLSLPSSSYGLHGTARERGQDAPAARTQRLRGRVWHDGTAAGQETRRGASVWLWRMMKDTVVMQSKEI